MAIGSVSLSLSQQARVATAVGNALDFGRDATDSEVNQFILDHLEDVVLGQERLAAFTSVVIESF